MPSTYSPDLRLELIAAGDKSLAWGAILTKNISPLLETAVTGINNVALTSSVYALTANNGVEDTSRNAVLRFTGTLVADCVVTMPTTNKIYIVDNATVGGHNIILSNGGLPISLPAGVSMVYVNETTISVLTGFSTGGIINGKTILSSTLSTVGASGLNPALNGLLQTPIITGVQIVGNIGEFTCNAASLVLGQLLTITGTYGGTGSITGYADPTTYKISATNGTTTFTLNTTSGASVTTSVGTPTGIIYTNGAISAVSPAPAGYVLSSIEGKWTPADLGLPTPGVADTILTVIDINGAQIVGTGGQFTCAANTLALGQLVTITGTYGGTGSITGYADPTTYKISATNGTTTFTLQTSLGVSIVTAAGIPTGLTYNSWAAAAIGNVGFQPQYVSNVHTAFTTTGTGSAYILTPTPPITNYVEGNRWMVKLHAAPTGSAPTINISGLGPKYLAFYTYNCLKVPINAYAAVAGWVADCYYDGEAIVMQQVITADIVQFPPTQKAIVGYGFIQNPAAGYINRSNIVSNVGVVSSDISGVGTARAQLTAATYGGDKAMFMGGSNNASITSVTNNVSSTGAIGSDVSYTTNYPSAIGCLVAYGGDKAVYISTHSTYPNSYPPFTRYVSNIGVVVGETVITTSTVGRTAGAGYGTRKAIIAFGNNLNNAFSPSATTNLISDMGIVSAEVAAVSGVTARFDSAGATYGGDKAIFRCGATTYNNYINTTNLVSNTGVMIADSTGVGINRQAPTASNYGGDKAIFLYGQYAYFVPNPVVNSSNLVSNVGIVATDVVNAGSTGSYYLAAAGFSFI